MSEPIESFYAFTTNCPESLRSVAESYGLKVSSCTNGKFPIYGADERISAIIAKSVKADGHNCDYSLVKPKLTRSERKRLKK